MIKPVLFTRFVFLFILFSAPTVLAQELHTLEANYLKGNYVQVVRMADSLLMTSKEPDTVLYLKGMASFKLQDVVQAQSIFRELMKQFPQSRWFGSAWMGIGDCFAYSGDHGRALDIYLDLYHNHQDTQIMAALLLRIGNAYYAQGAWASARDAYVQLADQYKLSEEAVEARAQLKANAFYFSVQVGAFANASNANRLQSELKRRGFSASLSKTVQKGRVFHRVRVGQFQSRPEAEAMAMRLKREGFPNRIFP